MTLTDLSLVNKAVLEELLMRFSGSSNAVKDFWKFMLVCFNTPRPSTNYDGVDKPERSLPIRNVIEALCRNSGLHYAEDKALNVIVSNNPGKKALVCFQGHMDVVVSKNESETHNFEAEGVDVCITPEGTLKPIKGITLGADNGVAIAAGLSILANHKSVPLELLVTQNEETGFDGARGLDASKLTADVLLNLDTEVEDEICVGSAGGFEQRFHIPVDFTPIHSEVYSIRLTNFKGGHSGIDIDKEKCNAILAMYRILVSLSGKFQLVSLNGGTSSNAIPRECYASISGLDGPEILQVIQAEFETLKSEIRYNEPDCMLVISKSSASRAFTKESTNLVLQLLSACPNGVVHRNMQTKDVESSVNIGMIQTNFDTNEVSVKMLARSTSVSWMKFFAKKLTSIGLMVGARVEELVGMFGSWEPDIGSGVVKKLIASHPKGIKPKLYSVHAGLEGSTIMERFAEAGRKIECASIGPQIEHAHSPDECLFIDSANNFVNWVDSYVRNH